jgi:hypothetical protein
MRSFLVFGTLCIYAAEEGILNLKREEKSGRYTKPTTGYVEAIQDLRRLTRPGAHEKREFEVEA